MLSHTHTHDTDYPILLLRDIQLIDTECIPYKYRTNAESTQDLVRFFREKYLKPHFGNVSWEGEL